jgi:MtaA/CmuA family methyltransferase
VDFIVKNYEDIGKVKLPDPEHDGRFPVVLNTIKTLKDMIGEFFMINGIVTGPLSIAGAIMEKTDYMMLFKERPDLLHELLEKTTEISVEYGKAQLKKGADGIVINDSLSSPSLIGPSRYKEFAFPYQKKVIKELENASLVMGGDVIPILDCLLDTGTSCVLLDHSCNVQKAIKQIDGKVAFRINLDPYIVHYCTPYEVEVKCGEIIRQFCSFKGFILGSGILPFDTPKENVKKIVETCRSIGGFR